MVESTEWEYFFPEHAWDWHWYPNSVAKFRDPLVRFLKGKEAVEDLTEKGSAPLLENNNWRRAELVKELDFRDVHSYFRFGEQTIFLDAIYLYRTITSDDTDCLLPLEAIVEMYRESKKSDRLLPDGQELYDRHLGGDYYLFIFDGNYSSDMPEGQPKWENGAFYLLVDECWWESGYVEANPLAVGIVFQSPFAKWILDAELMRSDQGWRRLPGLEYTGLHGGYSAHPITNRVECLQLLSNSAPFEQYAEHVAFNQKGLTEDAWAIIQDARVQRTELPMGQLHSSDGGEPTLKKLIRSTIGVDVDLRGESRFTESGWYYQGSTDLKCIECRQGSYEVFRKPYETSKGNYEYWGIVCAQCLSCTGLDVFDEPTRKLFRGWAQAIPGTQGKIAQSPSETSLDEPTISRGNDNSAKESGNRKPSFRSSNEEILPLPGDPGATRRPGKKREHYRTGEEASLRHIARKYRWWD